MQEDVDMEEVYHHGHHEEPGGLTAPERRLGCGDPKVPFLLSRQLSAGLFDAKFADNGGSDYCAHRGQCAADYCGRSERLESSTTDGSRTASTGSLVDEVGEDVYTLLGKFDISEGFPTIVCWKGQRQKIFLKKVFLKMNPQKEWISRTNEL
jgi:hypothetical protein